MAGMPPPELMAALMGGGGPPGMGGPPQGPPMGGPPPGMEGPSPEEAPPAPGDTLRQMIELAKVYVDVNPDDQQNSAVIKCMGILQQLLAQEQKEEEAATGVGPAARYLRKQQQGAQGAPVAAY